ncbi:TPR repeat-containing protein [Cryptosporidium muris RN66]|uniref:TPR repeat-containing protein n=1 Tax=Cryptosporidium muris (strain RN66) TaxID=441375 RepID=B6AH07_CRYMR|nr:TPR repeat-containing protein [Cryptosporidium muris RN66]EEA07498.1 TPR repeat-containing protein [Cryptosporidium muris RN66]|eukprot:XP_002141847.1 TPR repeat-containing protein [Cryptosporidium muris RN66]
MSSQAEFHKTKGNELYKQHKFEEALAEYDKAIELDPTEITYLTNKGAVYLEMGEYNKCLEVCQRALDIRYEVKADYSKVAKTFNRMASCYIKMNELQKAKEMYEKSLVEDNNRHTRTSLKELERLIEKAERESYINPDIAEEHRLKGNDLFKAKDYPGAKKEYDEAIKRNPNDSRLYSNRSACYMQLLEYPSALIDIQKALDIDPKFTKAWSRKGNIHYFLKEYHKAVQAYQEGLKCDPKNKECNDGLQNTLMKIQQVSSSDQIDEEQVSHALADPEIQSLLVDPQFRMILEQIKQNPAALTQVIQDPKIASGIQKLMAAGILRMG